MFQHIFSIQLISRLGRIQFWAHHRIRLRTTTVEGKARKYTMQVRIQPFYIIRDTKVRPPPHPWWIKAIIALNPRQVVECPKQDPLILASIIIWALLRVEHTYPGKCPIKILRTHSLSYWISKCLLHHQCAMIFRVQRYNKTYLSNNNNNNNKSGARLNCQRNRVTRRSSKVARVSEIQVLSILHKMHIDSEWAKQSLQARRRGILEDKHRISLIPTL